MRSITEAMLIEVARTLEARLDALARTPGAYIGNVACFVAAQEKRRIEMLGAEGNVIHVGQQATPLTLP